MLRGEERTVGWAVLWPVGLVLRMGVVIGKVRRGYLLMTSSSVSFCIEHYTGVRIARCYARLVPYRENASHGGRVYCTSVAYFERILINPQTATRGQIWPQPSFFFWYLFWCILQWHQPSWLCHDKCPLGRYSGFVLLVMTVFLKFRFSLFGIRFDPRWPCAFCFSVFSFVHFCGDNVL